jgi:hypothetical protein
LFSTFQFSLTLSRFNLLSYDALDLVMIHFFLD